MKLEVSACVYCEKPILPTQEYMFDFKYMRYAHLRKVDCRRFEESTPGFD